MNDKTCKSLLPCATCPWRVDQDASVIPGYDHRKAVGLLNTVGDNDAFRPIMACHGSREGNMHACLGYLARAGWNNLNVRLLLARSQIANPSAVLDACKAHRVRLHADYPKVLRKLARNLKRKRTGGKRPDLRRILE